MKKILSCLLLLASANVFAQFTPGQVLTAAQLNAQFALKAGIPVNCLGASFALNYQNPGNVWSCNGAINAVTLNGNTFQSPGPIGSVSPSTASFTNLTANGTLTFANGSITLPYLATQSANTVVANTTAGSASPTAASVPSCSTNASAINYTSGTGFGCNSAVNAAQLGGATFASPGAIGGTTPGSGAFTTLSSTGNFTPSQTNGIVGTTTNNNANAGSVGEFVTATGTAVSLTTAVTANITSISLTAGDWDVTASMLWQPAGSTSMTGWNGQISPTSATFNPALPSPTGAGGNFTTANGASQTAVIPSVRVSVASTTTIFLVANAAFSGGTCTASGIISARRRR